MHSYLLMQQPSKCRSTNAQHWAASHCCCRGFSEALVESENELDLAMYSASGYLNGWFRFRKPSAMHLCRSSFVEKLYKVVLTTNPHTLTNGDREHLKTKKKKRKRYTRFVIRPHSTFDKTALVGDKRFACQLVHHVVTKLHIANDLLIDAVTVSFLSLSRALEGVFQVQTGKSRQVLSSSERTFSALLSNHNQETKSFHCGVDE